MKLDDLTIFLKAVDQTKKATKSSIKNLVAVENRAKLISKTFKGVGLAISAAFVAGVRNGQELTDQLDRMRKELGGTLQESQALVNSVREVAPGAEIDALNEAMLTLKERFADAAVGAGPLKGLMDDFEGFELDLGVDNARDQLADFLEQVSELDSANEKIFALKEVIGDEDARAFFTIIQDTEKLTQLLQGLRTPVDEVKGVLSDFDSSAIQGAKESAAELGAAWDAFSIKAFAVVAPALELLRKGLTKLVDAGSAVLSGIGKLRDGLARLTGQYVDPVGVELTESASARISAIEAEANQSAAVIEGLIDGVNARGVATFTGPSAAPSQPAANDPIVVQPRAAPGHIDVRDEQELARLNAIGQDQSLSGRTDFNGLPGADLDAANDSLNRLGDRALTAQDHLNGVSNSMGALGEAVASFAAISGKNNDKSFKSFQKLQAGLALVSAWAGAAQTPADPTLPFYAKIAAFASILATGFNAVNTIKSLNQNSTNTAGADAGAAAGNISQTGPTGGTIQGDGGPQAAQQPINITIVGDGSISPNQLEEFVRELNDTDGLQINSNRIAS